LLIKEVRVRVPTDDAGGTSHDSRASNAGRGISLTAPAGTQVTEYASRVTRKLARDWGANGPAGAGVPKAGAN
jgi:hypothetical protein